MKKQQVAAPYSSRIYSNAAATFGTNTSSTNQHRVVLQVNDMAMGSITSQVETLPVVSHTEVNHASSQNQYSRFSTVNSTAYDHGTVIRVTATPASTNYVLDHFEDGDGNRLNTNTRLLRLEVTKDVTVRAVFRKVATPTKHAVHVGWNHSMGTVRCSDTLDANGDVQVNNGCTITLTAQPSQGYHFVRWEGVTVAGRANWNSTANPFSEQVFGPRNITAVFEADTPGISSENEEPGGGNGGGNGGENPGGNGGENPSNVETPVGGSPTLADRAKAFVKQWWWAILIVAYIVYKERKGGSR